MPGFVDISCIDIFAMVGWVLVLRCGVESSVKFLWWSLFARMNVGCLILCLCSENDWVFF